MTRWPHGSAVMLDTQATAMALGITPEALRQLVRAGRLSRCGGTVRQPEYDPAEVARLHAELWPDPLIGELTCTNAQRMSR